MWLIDIKTHSMVTFSHNSDKAVPDGKETADVLSSYEAICEWYINNYVLDIEREKMGFVTTLDYVLEKLSSDNTYYVDFTRSVNNVLNYNQLVYDAVCNDDGSIEYILLGLRDIDYRRRADIDEITGLYTRRAFLAKAEELVENNPDEQFDIIISDVQDFKKINESYGIITADKILHWIGNFLKSLMKDDLIIGRYGGDQMVMIGRHSDISGLTSFESGSRYIEEEKNNGLPSVITKFGVYENILHDKSIISSCDRAHIALNSIKGQYDKTMAFYDEAFREKVDIQRKIENGMYDALENEEFLVYYQPKHDAYTGKLVGAEALVRWNSKEHGFMNPADFIPLFEKNGFVVEIDNYVWSRTCRNVRKWIDEGITPTPISVNASKLTFDHPMFFNKLNEPISKYNVDPSFLHIEITETLMSEDVDELVRKLTAIKKAGFKIELDDFGAGYSSINILSTLPLDVVKLDMSFMKQFGDEKRAKVLIACINLAKQLGYKTVSEGVEHKEQCDFLALIGVDMIQGYYYSKPLSEAEFKQYMIEHA